MFEVEVLNLLTKEKFTKTFYSLGEKNWYVSRCKYSKKVKIVSIFDYSHLM